LSITNITASGSTVTITCYNHNLIVGQYVLLENIVSSTGAMAAVLNEFIFSVVAVPNANTFKIIAAGATDTYYGGGTVQLVSQVDILTKQYNPYAPKGQNVTIGKVDFLVDKTDTGSITVDYWASSSEVSLVNTGESSGAQLGTSVLETTPYALYPFEQTQERLWHPLYFQTDGECIQFRLYYSDDQMEDPDVVFDDFQLHATALYAQPTSRLQ
jgi:hypothetical protein